MRTRGEAKNSPATRDASGAYHKPPPPWALKNAVAGKRAMICPDCGGNTSVVDSRQRAGACQRRRVCMSCNLRFVTYERLEADRQEFDELRAQLLALSEQILVKLGCPVCEPDQEAAE
jgi:hypothetical protein